MENPQFQQVKDSAPFKRWPCVYPIYLDANVSLQGGRRVSKKYAYPDPLPRAIVEAVRRLKLPIFLEPQKVHPRESGSIRSGRIRVQLLDEDGKQIHPEIPNRMSPSLSP